MSEVEPPIIEEEKKFICPHCSKIQQQTCKEVVERFNKNLGNYFDHTRKRKMNYCEHFYKSFWNCFRLLASSVGYVIHAVYPDILTTSLEDLVISIGSEIKEERNKVEN